MIRAFFSGSQKYTSEQQLQPIRCPGVLPVFWTSLFSFLPKYILEGVMHVDLQASEPLCFHSEAAENAKLQFQSNRFLECLQ